MISHIYIYDSMYKTCVFVCICCVCCFPEPPPTIHQDAVRWEWRRRKSPWWARWFKRPICCVKSWFPKLGIRNPIFQASQTQTWSPIKAQEGLLLLKPLSRTGRTTCSIQDLDWDQNAMFLPPNTQQSHTKCCPFTKKKDLCLLVVQSDNHNVASVKLGTPLQETIRFQV